MSLDVAAASTEVVTSSAQLVALLRAAETSRDRFRIGLEHEKILVDKTTLGPVPYDGPRGIRAVLERLGRFGLAPFLEDGHPIAMSRDGLLVSLEPGGQTELSGRPSTSIAAIHAENAHHIAQVRAIGAELGLVPLGVGYRPFGRLEAMPWMPKRRYLAMRAYLARAGSFGHQMMLMTGSTQASLDWCDEDDLAARVRAAASIASIVGALYANSPIADGADSGYASFRMHVWSEVDRTRCGLLPMFFDGRFSYRRYVEWALDVPVIFVRRGGQYLDAGGRTFRDLVRKGLDGGFPTVADWDDHMTTVFTEVRVKRVLEVRSADAGDLALSAALPALLKGLLYDRDGMAACVSATRRLRFEQRVALHEEAARHGLAARAGRARLLDLARDLVGAARAGLRRQDPSETRFLEPLEEISSSGRTRADVVARECLRRGPEVRPLIDLWALP